MIIIIMGVSGSGKTVVGKALSDTLNIPFLDADDFHPDRNINKMKSGVPLTDEDRLPWLQNLSRVMYEHEMKSGGILACSALKVSYRELLSEKLSNPKWVFLKGDFELIKERIQNRKGHFMPEVLLKSQFETLEPPKGAIVEDITKSHQEIVNSIIKKLNYG